MISFRNDYSEGAHPKILEALVRTNFDCTAGYGTDEYCARAADALRTRFACPDADVHFLPGGTITNLTSIAAFLRPWEAVIAAKTGHIFVHETGAIEATGHKVYAVDTTDGKLTPELIRDAVMAHRDGTEEHMVMPRMVYISDSTELGTLYKKSELAAIRDVCDELGLYLYLDGARMGAALVAEDNDLAPEDFPKYCDAFYVGGTKNGLLFGEALVITRDELKPYFRNCIKQRGAMFAKGRLLGVQFEEFFRDDLWLNAAWHAVANAQRLAKGMQDKGIRFYAQSTTNQIFPIFDNALMHRLEKDFIFEFTAHVDENHTAVRFVT
ncbi:MAG: threonine aldolase, partial [Oscillospiraceae bacterium]|nr:threonine aldolase [Oscillospiraceae bacterium]